MPQTRKGWPADFDFEHDPVCQKSFRPYIEDQLQKLAAFDARRPKETTYIFHEHARRVAQDVKNACLHLHLGDAVANNMYWAILIHDIGKMQLPIEIWDKAEKPSEQMKAFRRTHTRLGADSFSRHFAHIEHPFKDLALEIMRYHHEQMDGMGTEKLPAEALSPPVRLAAIVEAFDGWSIPRPHFGKRDVKPPAVLKRMKTEKAHMFDAELLESFAEMKTAEYKKTSRKRKKKE
ncbi:MAG: HD domain-containing protein [Rhodospirillales bacterium]|nr:HD domain-containing protein [Alphaproteobacteria bacterium]MCB1839978.1 HD domain-containing protein [Alphaproteobacteria bacterium]MCB9976662.1 HD domain-containing protein [Rhodospirillales bacterium]